MVSPIAGDYGRSMADNDVVLVYRLAGARVVEVTDVAGGDAGFWS
jgi:hypothetical protein